MASLYKRGKVWWIKYRDENGKIQRETTGLRTDSRAETREAGALLRGKVAEEELNRKERRCGQREGPPEARGAKGETKRHWDWWVDDYLVLRHRENPKTLTRYTNAWTTVRWWLQGQGVREPSEVTRELAMEYASWRGREKEPVPGRSPKHPEVLKAAPSTVVLEMKVWAGVMDEAVERGWALRNPCRRLGLSRKALRKKPEITLEEERQIRKALAGEAEWMRVSFNLAMAQGMRLSETQIDLEKDVNWDRETVTVHGKGGRTYSTLLNPDVVPMLRALRAEGKRYSCVVTGQASRDWLRFFRKEGLGHLSFHCTRVTAITRAARAGVPRSQALRFFNHASNAVHDIYTRLEVDDTPEALEALRSECEVEW